MNKEQPEALQLPTLPFAVFDESGQPCEDRVRDHFAAAFEELRAQIGQGVPVAWLVCSVNKDGSLSLEHAAAWKEAAHEHINDAITEHGIADAASWVVRPAYTHPAPQAVVVQQEAATAWQSIEAVAAQRYKVGLAHDSMFYRHAVVAGDGSQQLYIGRKTECENMARKFAGAFLDGAYLANLYTNPAPQQKPLTDEQIKLAIYKQCPDFDDWHEGPSIDDVIAIVKTAHTIGEKK